MDNSSPESGAPQQLKESKYPAHQARVEEVRDNLRIKKPNSPVEDIHQEARDKVAHEIVRERLRREIRVAKESATRDPLTELYNRRFFDEQVLRGITMVNRNPQSHRMFLTVSDIDDYGMFNGKYGMATGDEVLVETAKVYTSSTRGGTDTVARLGGEELAVLSVYDNSETGTQDLGEYIRPITRVQEKMNDMKIHDSKGNEIPDKITSSFGVTRYIPGEDEKTFKIRAETAVRFAKMLGKDRVVIMIPNPDGTHLLDDLSNGKSYVYWTETEQDGDNTKVIEYIVDDNTGEQQIVVPIEKGKSKLVTIGTDNNG